MANLKLSFSCATVDNRNRNIIDGSVKPEGIELVYSKARNIDDLFREILNEARIDISELSLSNYICATGMGLKYKAIPVFPSRHFRHSNIYVNKNAGIKSPSDLNRKKIASNPEYFVTASIWQRGILQHEYGVHPSNVEWFVWKDEKMPFKFPNGISTKRLQKNPWEALESGEIDAVIGPTRPPKENMEHIARLFPDVKNAEAEYYRKTGIYPIMHAMVIKDEIWKENGWVARSLIDAFTESKKKWAESSGSGGGLEWIPIYLEEERAVLGDDPYPYNIKDNRKTLQALIDYCYEQTVMTRKPSIEELFIIDA